MVVGESRALTGEGVRGRECAGEDPPGVGVVPPGPSGEGEGLFLGDSKPRPKNEEGQRMPTS